MSDNIRETRTAAFAACPETGCDWSSFWRGWQAALAAAPAVPAAQEPATWISVADRLPSEDSEVIVSGWAYNDPARGRFVTHADFSDGQFKPVGAADEYDALHPPTHWMPMPAAPGEAPTPAAEQPIRATQALATISRMARNEACRSGAPAAGQLCTWDSIADMADAALADAPAAEQPEKLLDQPAKVGAVRFHAGVSERLVIECAQRHYRYEQAPPFGDDQINSLAQALGYAKQPDTVAVPRELLREVARLLEAHDAGGGSLEGATAADLRALLAGGAE